MQDKERKTYETRMDRMGRIGKNDEGRVSRGIGA
jgi:hypothetical protein